MTKLGLINLKYRFKVEIKNQFDALTTGGNNLKLIIPEHPCEALYYTVVPLI